MNDLSAFDILLYGALSGVVLVAVCAGLWALAWRGRCRFNAERRGDADLIAHWEHCARKQFECAQGTDDPMGKRVMEHGATVYFNCAQELKASRVLTSPQPEASP